MIEYSYGIGAYLHINTILECVLQQMGAEGNAARERACRKLGEAEDKIDKGEI
jgi:hypothetical protein